MVHILLAVGLVLIALVLVWKRVLAFVLAVAARRRGVQLTVDTFTITAASGLRIKCQKGLFEEIRVRGIQIGWGGSTHQSEHCSSLPSWGPKLRLSISGVQLTLRAAPRVRDAPSSAKGVDTDTGVHGNVSKPVANAATGSESPGAALRFLGMMQFLLIDMQEVGVLDNDGAELLLLKSGSFVPFAAEQNLRVEGLTVLPPKRHTTANPTTSPLVQLESIGCTHDGTLSALGGLLLSRTPSIPPSQTVLPRLSVSVGDITACVKPDVIQRVRSLLLSPPAASSKNPLPQDSGGRDVADSTAHPLRPPGLMSTLQMLRVHAAVTITKLRATGETAAGICGEVLLEHAQLGCSRSACEGGTLQNCSVELTWRRLACTLTSPTISCPAMDVHCSTATLRIGASHDALPRASASSFAETDADVGHTFDASIQINSMHTRIQHRALPEIARMTNIDKATRQDDALGTCDSKGISSTNNHQKPHQTSKYAQHIPRWQLGIRLGEDSSLQFMDSNMECMWYSSIHSAALNLATSEQHLYNETSDASSGSALAAAANISARFEAREIVMQTAMPPTMGGKMTLSPDRVLFTQSVHLEWKPPIPLSSVPNDDGNPAATDSHHPVITLSTQSVYVLLHASSVAAFSDVADAMSSLVAPPSSSANRHAAQKFDNVPKQQRPSDKCRVYRFSMLPRLSIQFCDTMIVAPATVAIPSLHSFTGKLHAVHGAVGALVGEVSVDASSVSRCGKLSLRSLHVVHCEGLAAQKLPLSGETLLNAARCKVLSIDAAVLIQEIAEVFSNTPEDNETGVAASLLRYHRRQHIKVGKASALADVDAIGCAIQASDEALGMIRALKNSVQDFKRRGSHDGEPAIAKHTDATPLAPRDRMRTLQDDGSFQAGEKMSPKVAASAGTRALLLEIEADDLMLSVPLSPDMEVSLQVRSLATHINNVKRLQDHRIRLNEARLTLKGKSVVQIKEFSGSLRTGSGNAALPHIQTDELQLRELEENQMKEQVLRHQAADEDSYWSNTGGATPPREPSDQSLPSNPYLGNAPASTANVHIDGFELCVPHDREPGPTLRYAQMYFKAVQAAILPKRKGNLKNYSTFAANSKGDASRRALEKVSLLPLQLNATATNVDLRFEHHPMEAWMSVHGPLLRRVTVHRHVCEEASLEEADQNSDKWQKLMQDISRSYIQSVHMERQAKPCSATTPDVLHVRVDRCQAMVVTCAEGAEGAENQDQGLHPAVQAATAFICRVDPPSADVQFAACRQLHIHAALQGVSVKLSCANKPLVAAHRLCISGPLAVAQQATANAATATRRLGVGMHRTVPVAVNVRGCRAPFKLYTEVQIDADDLRVCFSPGFDPFFALAGMAGKRLSPSDPDKTAARPPPVPWWDDIRYLWRGRAAIESAGLDVTLAAHHLPHVDDTSERMVVTAGAVSGKFGNNGEHVVTMLDLDVRMYCSPGVEHPGRAGALLVLPFVHAPVGRISTKLRWKFPEGRLAEHHHLFPADPASVQEQHPVFVGLIYKADGLDVDVHAEFPQHEHANAEDVRGTSAAAAPAVGYLGDYQVMFIRRFVRTLRATPQNIRAVAKRGTFFARKPRGGPPKKGLPRLLQLFRVYVSADNLEIVHFTVNPQDPSAALIAATKDSSFEASWLCNQPLPSFLRLPPHIKSKQPAHSVQTRSIARSLALRFADVRIRKEEPLDGDAASTLSGMAPRGSRQDAASTAYDSGLQYEDEGTRLAAELLQSLVDVQGGIKEDDAVIFADAVVVSRQAAEDSFAHKDIHGITTTQGADPLTDAFGKPAQRPLRVVVSGCRFLVDLATRNAVWGAVSHLVAAFGPRPAADPLHRTWTAVSPSPSVGRTPSPLPYSLSPAASLSRRDATAELQRRMSGHLSMRSASQASELPPETNELLSFLLRQRERVADEGSTGAVTPQPTSGDELPAAVHEVDDDEGDERDATEGPMSTPLDDIHSTVRFEVEVVNFQAMLLPAAASTVSGRLLLAARAGRLRGLTLAEGPVPLRITTLGLDAAQAYVSVTDVDPHVGLTWLQVDPHAQTFVPPSEIGPAPLRRVFSPIRIDLRHSKAPSSSITTRRGGATRSPVLLRSPTNGGPSGLGMALKAEELVLKIPEIAAVMDGREFAVLAEVVALLLTPGPSIQTVTFEERLLVESENDAVEDGRQLLALVRQQLVCVQREAVEIRRTAGAVLYRIPAEGGADEADVTPSIDDIGALRSNQNATFAALNTQKDPAPAPRAADAHVLVPGDEDHALAAEHRYRSAPDEEQAETSPGISPFGSSPDRLSWLLTWIDEQETTALATYVHAKASLLEVKASASKQLLRRAASRVLLQLDRIVWQMCTPDKQPFVQASLRGVSYDLHRNRDHSGSAKFIIHRVDIIDATGALPEGPATAPGVILTVWNPDNSYEREPTLRVVATMGVPSPTHTIFEHLDATLHPLSVHLTESIAVECWEYFFPKEDSKTRQEAFTQTVGGGTRSKRGPIATEGAASAPNRDAFAGAGSTTGSGDFGMQTGSLSSAAIAVSPKQARAAFMDPPGTPQREAGFFGGGKCSAPPTPSAAAGAAAGAAPGDAAAASQRMASRLPSSQTHAFQSLAFSSSSGAPPAMEASSTDASQRRTNDAEATARTLKRFVYVKLNRAHLRVTYQGYPIGIRDRILVMNSYACENLDGRWRDLLANVKQKAILSAVWSGLGLQGRKIKELMEGAAPAVPVAPPPELARSGGSGPMGGLLAKMGVGGKARRDAGQNQGLDEEELRALQKKRALFGDQILKNIAKQRGAATSTGASSSASAVVFGALGDGAAALGGSRGSSALPSATSTPSASPSKSAAVAMHDQGYFSGHTAIVPPLDLRQPLPSEDDKIPGPLPTVKSQDVSRRGSGTSARSAPTVEPPASSMYASPLQAGMHAVARAGAKISTMASGSNPKAEDDPAGALLGQAFRQQQQQQSVQQDAVAVQLLGHGATGSPKKSPQRWVQQLASKARDLGSGGGSGGLGSERRHASGPSASPRS